MNGIRNYETFGYIASMSTAVITKETLGPGMPNPTPMCDPDFQQAIWDYDTLDTNEKEIPHEFIPSEGGHNFEFWREAIVRILDWLPHGEMIPILDSGDVFGKS